MLDTKKILGYLFEVFTKEAESETIDWVKSFLKGKPTDQETERALIAMKAAIASFFKTYGDQFGPRKKSFIVWEKNIELMLNRIRLGKGSLRVEQFMTTGQGDYPEVTPEALQFLIDEYEKELIKTPAMEDRLMTNDHFQDSKEILEKLNQLTQTPSPDSSPPPLEKPRLNKRSTSHAYPAPAGRNSSVGKDG